KDMVSKVAPTPRTPSTESLRQGQSGGFTSRGTFSFRNKVLEPSKHDLWLLSLHFGGEAAAVELERDGVADLALGGVAEAGAGAGRGGKSFNRRAGVVGGAGRADDENRDARRVRECGGREPGCGSASVRRERRGGRRCACRIRGGFAQRARQQPKGWKHER